MKLEDEAHLVAQPHRRSHARGKLPDPQHCRGHITRRARDRLLYLTERTGLTHRVKQRIQKLSGGERQRTAVCRALMNRSGILLADEPTGSLDARTSDQIFSLLLEMAATERITLIMATHDRELARRCHRLIDIKDGKVCHEGLA